MKTIQIFIFISVVYHLGFALFHAFFWKIFGWNRSLPKMNVADRAILQIANLCLIWVFLFFAALIGLSEESLLLGFYGKMMIAFVLGFWILRFGYQFLFLPQNNRMVQILNLVFLVGIFIHSGLLYFVF